MSALSPDRRVELLSGSPVGRAVLAEFAKFNPDEWEPHPLGRGPRAGTTVFRRKVGQRWQYRDTLPPGYIVQGKKVVHKDAVTSVTVPANTPRTQQGILSLDYVPTDPLTAWHNVGADGRSFDGDRIPEAVVDRLARLSLLHIARQRKNDLWRNNPNTTLRGMHPDVAALIPHAERYADDTRTDPSVNYRQIINDVADRAFHPSHDHVYHALVSPSDPYLAGRISRSELLRAHLRNSLGPSTDPAAVAKRRTQVANGLHSIYYVGPEIQIPVTPQIRAMAQKAYDESDPDVFVPLSDALEEQGAHRWVLQNLRSPDSAVRGNWVLDAILGKR